MRGMRAKASCLKSARARERERERRRRETSEGTDTHAHARHAGVQRRSDLAMENVVFVGWEKKNRQQKKKKDRELPGWGGREGVAPRGAVVRSDGGLRRRTNDLTNRELTHDGESVTIAVGPPLIARIECGVVRPVLIKCPARKEKHRHFIFIFTASILWFTSHSQQALLY